MLFSEAFVGKTKPLNNMKTQIDIKSAAIGLVVGIAAIFAIGAANSTDSNGRYQVTVAPGSNPNQAGFAIMVDTQTGKAWGANIQNDFHTGQFWDAK